MTNWSEGAVRANGIRLYYYRTGGDKPPLLLAHGLTDSGLCWTPVVQALEDEYDCIMVDARGHGRSDVPAQGYTNAEHAADYAGLISALSLPQPVMLGHSMGAATAAQLAATYPTLVRGVILEDPPWRLPGTAAAPADRAKMAQDWRANVIANRRKTHPDLVAANRLERPTWSTAERTPWATAKLQCSPNVIDYAQHPSTPWSEVVGQITCPVLLLMGDPELGGIISPALARAVSAQNAKVRTTHIAGAGHSIRREQFDAYVTAVRGFLAEIYA